MPQVEALVERLEQLLGELEHADERMSAMSDLLRAAEEANQAELEERRQIERWIGEIERRVGERKSEWQAERDVINRKVRELTEKLERAEQQIGRMPNDGKKAPDGGEYLAECRRENTALNEQLTQSQEQCRMLAERLAAGDVEHAENRVKEAVAEAVREGRLELAQERATLARERAEFVRLRDLFEQERQKLEQNPNGADQRIRVFREHLRELHETETQKRKTSSAGVSSRIARLWRSLDSRG